MNSKQSPEIFTHQTKKAVGSKQKPLSKDTKNLSPKQTNTQIADTEQETLNCFVGAINHLEEEQKKNYKLEQEKTKLEQFIKEVKVDYNKMKNQMELIENSKKEKSQKRQDLMTILKKMGNALPEEFKNQCDQDVDKMMAEIRSEFFKNN